MEQRNRNPVKNKKIARSLNDMEAHKYLTDRRSTRGRRRLIPFRALTSALMVGMCCACRSLQEVEELSAELQPEIRRSTGIAKRVSDSTLQRTTRQLRSAETRGLIHRQIKAAHRRGQLRSRFPISVVSVDGKGLGKLDDWGHPAVQPVFPEHGRPYGLCRVLRATLVTSRAAVCIDEAPIPGDTNEMGFFSTFLVDLQKTYGHTSLCDALMFDAGLACQETVNYIDEVMQRGYIARLKGNQGDIHLDAVNWLERTSPQQPPLETREKGKYIHFHFYRVQLDGSAFHGWSHVRQLIRIKRQEYAIVRDKKGRQVRGPKLREKNRYWASNLSWARLSAKQWLELLRSHWRCENENHWTCDVLFREDAKRTKRTPWTTDPETIYALGDLRMVALNILALLRAESRRDGDRGTLSWRSVVKRIDSVLTGDRSHINWTCYGAPTRS